MKRYQYNSFGEVTTFDKDGNEIAFDSGVKNNFAFTSRYYEPELGLYYYRARWYDPKTSRFLSEDPIGFAGGDSNFYRYVENNPVKFSDPIGLAKCIYSISTGQLSCSSNIGGDLTTVQMFSGNGNYKNNPNATGISNKGPMPVGSYNVYHAPEKDRRDWFLDPGLISRIGYQLKLNRGGFKLHLRGGGSNGCITGTDNSSTTNLNTIQNLLLNDMPNV